MASMLWWHFTPAPDRVIKLPTLSKVCENDIWRPNLHLVASDNWVVVVGMSPSRLPSHFTFANTTTGKISEWALPYSDLSERYGFVLAPRDSTLRVLTISDFLPNRLLSYAPETQVETVVTIPRLAGRPSDSKAHDLNNGETAIVSVRYTEHEELQFQVTDLTTGEPKPPIEVQGLDLSPLESPRVDDIDASPAPDAKRVAIRLTYPIHLTIVCDATSGQIIQKQQVQARDWKQALPWSTDKAVSETVSKGFSPRLEARPNSRRFRLHTENGILSCPEGLGTTYFMDASTSFAKVMDPPKLVPGTSGVVSIETTHYPGPLEKWWRQMLAKLQIQQELPRNYQGVAHWFDSKSQSFHPFRVASEDEEVWGRFAVAEATIYLLVVPKTGCPQIEIWNAPPVRPKLAIWICSLLVTCATWFWLRRSEKQRGTPK